MHPERYERKICIVFWFCSFTLKGTYKNDNNTLKIKIINPLIILYVRENQN